MQKPDFGRRRRTASAVGIDAPAADSKNRDHMNFNEHILPIQSTLNWHYGSCQPPKLGDITLAKE
jgi:hypothetical protein